MGDTVHVSHASVADHRAAIARLLGTGTCQTVVLDRHAAGRRVAADLAAADDLPRFDNSAMDGYAVRAAHPDQREFVVVADVPAGSPADVGLSPGEAARIMTGARVPGSAVAVVPVEQTDAAATGPAPERVTLTVDAIPGRHIRRQGEDVMAGSVVAPAGTLITPRLIALARSAGCFAAVVWTPMRVAVVATGTELIDPGHLLGAAGIHESNSDMVGALAESAGCIVTSVDICSDDPDGLTALLRDLDRRTTSTSSSRPEASARVPSRSSDRWARHSGGSTSAIWPCSRAGPRASAGSGPPPSCVSLAHR